MALRTAPIPASPIFSRIGYGAKITKIGEGAGLRRYVDGKGVVSYEYASDKIKIPVYVHEAR